MSAWYRDISIVEKQLFYKTNLTNERISQWLNLIFVICVQRRRASWTSPCFWRWCTGRFSRSSPKLKFWQRWECLTNRREATSQRLNCGPNSPRWERNSQTKKVTPELEQISKQWNFGKSLLASRGLGGVAVHWNLIIFSDAGLTVINTLGL